MNILENIQFQQNKKVMLPNKNQELSNRRRNKNLLISRNYLEIPSLTTRKILNLDCKKKINENSFNKSEESFCGSFNITNSIIAINESRNIKQKLCGNTKSFDISNNLQQIIPCYNSHVESSRPLLEINQLKESLINQLIISKKGSYSYIDSENKHFPMTILSILPQNFLIYISSIKKPTTKHYEDCINVTKKGSKYNYSPKMQDCSKIYMFFKSEYSIEIRIIITFERERGSHLNFMSLSSKDKQKYLLNRIFKDPIMAAQKGSILLTNRKAKSRTYMKKIIDNSQYLKTDNTSFCGGTLSCERQKSVKKNREESNTINLIKKIILMRKSNLRQLKKVMVVNLNNNKSKLKNSEKQYIISSLLVRINLHIYSKYRVGDI